MNLCELYQVALYRRTTLFLFCIVFGLHPFGDKSSVFIVIIKVRSPRGGWLGDSIDCSVPFLHGIRA